MKIAVPVILIILVMIDLLKAVMASDEKGIQTSQKLLVRRIIYGVAVFFVVTLVQIVTGFVAGNMYKEGNKDEIDDASKCWQCAMRPTSGDCDRYAKDVKKYLNQKENNEDHSSGGKDDSSSGDKKEEKIEDSDKILTDFSNVKRVIFCESMVDQYAQFQYGGIGGITDCKDNDTYIHPHNISCSDKIGATWKNARGEVCEKIDAKTDSNYSYLVQCCCDQSGQECGQASSWLKTYVRASCEGVTDTIGNKNNICNIQQTIPDCKIISTDGGGWEQDSVNRCKRSSSYGSR